MYTSFLIFLLEPFLIEWNEQVRGKRFERWQSVEYFIKCIQQFAPLELILWKIFWRTIDYRIFSLRG